MLLMVALSSVNCLLSYVQMEFYLFYREKGKDLCFMLIIAIQKHFKLIIIKIRMITQWLFITVRKIELNNLKNFKNVCNVDVVFFDLSKIKKLKFSPFLQYSFFFSKKKD